MRGGPVRLVGRGRRGRRGEEKKGGWRGGCTFAPSISPVHGQQEPNEQNEAGKSVLSIRQFSAYGENAI